MMFLGGIWRLIPFSAHDVVQPIMQIKRIISLLVMVLDLAFLILRRQHQREVGQLLESFQLFYTVDTLGDSFLIVKVLKLFLPVSDLHFLY